jgi:hypothetical protein
MRSLLSNDFWTRVYFMFFTRDGWKYMFAPRAFLSDGWPSVLWCRFNGHPPGVYWYNLGGDEPNMTCRGCGDDLG